MRLKTKRYAKLAVTSLIAAFSFGLAISCVSNHKQNINKVFAEGDVSTTWSYNSSNNTLSCTYASNYPNGFIDQTNQVSVTGLGGGQYELEYQVLGYPSGAIEPDTTDYGTFKLVFISGYYDSTASTDAPYGSITAYPLDVSGLDSSIAYEIYLKVEPTGDMSQQGSGSIYYDNGEFYSQEAGSDALVLSSIKFYGDITYENGSADLVFVNGNGDNMGTVRMSPIEFSSKPEGDGSYYTGNISGTLETTSQQVENYYSNGARFWDEEVFNPNTAEWSWDSGARAYSCDYTPASTGITITYKALFLPPSGATGTDQIICEYTQGSGTANVRTTIYNHNDGDPIETGMTKNFEFLLTDEPSLIGDYYEFQFADATATNTFTIAATYVSIVEQQIPEPPALSALQWYFDTDMGYFTTNLYNDNYYSFSLSTEIISVIYDRANSSLTARCLVTARDGNMPEEYYDAEITFAYTFASSGLVEDAYHFYDAVCETTVEETESLYFSVDVVSFRQLGWYYDEDLRYYVEEGVEADWEIEHVDYRREGQRNELVLYMDVIVGKGTADEEHIFPQFDVIQINNPTFDNAPIPGQSEIDTGVSGYSDKLSQNITVQCTSILSYFTDGWSYDAYHLALVYISSGDIEAEYELISATVDGDDYTLTYVGTVDGDEDTQTIVVTAESYNGETLEGFVKLNGSTANTSVTINLDESLIDSGGTDYEYGWNYDSSNHSLVYYDEDFGGEYSMVQGVNNVADKVITLTYSGREPTGGEQDIQTIDINYSSGGGYDDSENTVSGYALLDGSNEYITVLLNVDLLEANTWVYIDGRMYWKDINSSNIDTNYLDINKFVFVTCEDNLDNQYAEIDYTYTNDGTTLNLPTLILNSATYSPDGDIYYVSGSYYGSSVEIEIPESKWKTREYGTYDYEVIFDGNGATSGSMAVDEFNTTEYSFDYVLPECGYKREGYKFIGWGHTPDATFMKFQPGETRNITNGTTTFYALWESSKTFTISFNPNGGIGYMESLTVESGRNQVPECGFTRPGYIFDCWAVGSADSSLKVNAGSYVSVDGNYALYALWLPGVKPEEAIEPGTIDDIDARLSELGVTASFDELVSGNEEYISKEAGEMVKDALLGTTLADPDDYTPEDYAVVVAAQKELVETVVATGLSVEATKASSVSGAQEIDKALPDNANFSVEGEIKEFYERQMAELFGGQTDRKRIYRSNEEPTHSIDTDVSGMSANEAVDHLENEQSLYENMVDYVDTGVEHMGKAALKLRVCSGESVTVQVKSYVTDVKVSSYRDFDKAAADKEFVEAVYKAILLSMQHEVISILESEHKPSNNAEKEAQYQKELDAVKDLETFEIMVTEVLRQKYVELTGIEVADVDAFKPIYWEIFTAWALDQPSPYNISLEELTQTTIEQSKNRAGTFIVHSDLSKAEWGFIAGIAGGAALIIAAAAIIPTIVYKKRKEEGIN